MKINQLMLAAAIAVYGLPAAAENTAVNTVTNAVGTAANNVVTAGKVVADKVVDVVTRRGAGAVSDPRDDESGLTPAQKAQVAAANAAAANTGIANTTAAAEAAAYGKIVNSGTPYGVGIVSAPKKPAVRHVSHAKGKKHHAHSVQRVQHRPDVNRVSTVPQTVRPLQLAPPSESPPEVKNKLIEAAPAPATILNRPLGTQQYDEHDLYHGA